jgi:Poly(A) polymerase catalytic subunit
MTFEDCELAILRHAVDTAEARAKKKDIRNPEIKEIIRILEEFLASKKLVCYGGTAINNILPKEAQFYDRDSEIPDYDFYSPHALEHAIELADLYYSKGYQEVESKAGVHYGTFKVYVNFIPIADITLLPKSLYDNIHKDAISIAGILYAPPNFLRMNMYLELSRPAGDVSRWEKVLKRLTILNKFYSPMKQFKCSTVDFQRKMDDIDPKADHALEERIYFTVRDTLIDQGVVFFGGYASSLYGDYMPPKERRLVQKVPDFDVLSEDPIRTTTIVQERLHDIGITNVVIEKRQGMGEIIPDHWEIRVGRDILGHVYEPIACHSYNEVSYGGRQIRIATIDTMLTFFLAFIYSGIIYHDEERILCMVEYLYKVQERNRLEQRGILKRYSIQCIGKQPTLEEIRAEKTRKFKELSEHPESHEYKMWFLKYSPGGKKATTKTKAKKATKNKTKKRVLDKNPRDKDYLWG